MIVEQPLNKPIIRTSKKGLPTNSEKFFKPLSALSSRLAGVEGLEPPAPGFGVMVNVVTQSIHST